MLHPVLLSLTTSLFQTGPCRIILLIVNLTPSHLSLSPSHSPPPSLAPRLLNGCTGGVF